MFFDAIQFWEMAIDDLCAVFNTQEARGRFVKQDAYS